MQTKYSYTLNECNRLKSLSFDALEKKIDDLDDLYVMDEKVNQEHKKGKYQGYILRELSILEHIKFDGYIMLLMELINYARQSNIFIDCFGSIQNSLVTYLLDINTNFEFKSMKEFTHFTPFTKRPIINIVADSARILELINYLNHKYKNLIKNSDHNSVEFLEPLIIKFIDLDIGNKNNITEDEALYLGLEIQEPIDNITEYKYSVITKQNKVLLKE